MMLRILCLLLLMAVPAAGDALSRKAARANREYEKGKYEEAAKGYLGAQLEAPDSGPLNYNLGGANYKLKKYQKALDYLTKATSTDNVDLEQKIQYNLGNLLYKMGEQESSQGKQEGLDKLKQSIQHYKRALDLKPDDMDAKYNLEFVRRKLKEMTKRQKQKPKQQQKQQKEQKQKQQKRQQPDSTKQQKQKPRRKPGEMSEEEAKRLLDAFKDAEKDAKKKKQRLPGSRVRIEKDW